MGEPTYVDPVWGAGLTEIRIHGVSGPDPRNILETPEVFRVAGDNITGFMRRLENGVYGPVDAPRPARAMEAYSWRGVSSGGSSRAIWLLLAPFALLNVASWMHPIPPDPNDATRPRVDPWNDGRVRVLHALLRALALSLTAMFGLVIAAALRDVPRRGKVRCPPLWKHCSYVGIGQRLVYVPVLVLAIAVFVTLRRYERTASPTALKATAASPLEVSRVWHRKRSVERNALLHVATLAAAVWFLSRLQRSATVDRVGAAILVVLLLGAAAVEGWFSMRTDLGSATPTGGPSPTASPPPPRNSVVPSLTQAIVFYAIWAVGIAGVVVVVVRRTPHLPATGGLVQAAGSDPFHLGGALAFVVCLQALLLVAIFIVVQLALSNAPKNRHHDRLLGGHALTLVAMIAWVLSAILACAVILAVSNLMLTGKPGVQTPGIAELTDTGSVTVASAAGLMVLVLLVRWVRSFVFYNKARLEQRNAWLGLRFDYAVAAEAHEAYFALIPLALAAVAWIGYVLLVLLRGWHLVTVHALVAAFAYVLVGIPMVLKKLRKDVSLRRSIGILWDVVTFWPRAVHPLGPPCYAERAVPQLVARHRAFRGDGKGRVLVSAHSQGAVISAAMLFQLTDGEIEKTALVTYGCQYSYLFARAFPAYLGGICLDRLAARLGAPEKLRWLNLYRYTDHLGMPVNLTTDYPDHNREVADPPIARATGGQADIRLSLQRPGPWPPGDQRPDRAAQTHSNYPASWEYDRAIEQLEATLQ
jgi:hypothetical protein